MPLRMALNPLDDGGHIPRFYCDHCTNPIVDADQGNALWVRMSNAIEVEPTDVYFVHRGECDEAMQKRLDARDKITLWDDLSEFSLRLLNRSFASVPRPDKTPVIKLTEAHPQFDSASSITW